MRKDVCVVLPAYKPFQSLNSNEKEAVFQMSRVFRNRDLFIVAPERYADYPCEFKSFTLFDKKYFTYGGYNDLCKSDFFYQTFINMGYRYMCLIQADVWAFQDSLDYFLNLFDKYNYDYIGAPWYGVWFAPDGTVGNGGFCIRKLETFRNICRDYPQGGGNEDVYFLKTHGNKLRIAGEKLGLEFSWEEKPCFAFKLANGRLPLGTHAYASQPDRISFWRQFIPNIQEIKCQAGEMDVYNNPNHIVDA